MDEETKAYESIPEFADPLSYLNKKKKNRNFKPVDKDIEEDLFDEKIAVDKDYELLLDRLFEKLLAMKPGLVMKGEKPKFKLIPVFLARVGSKRTLFRNFGQECLLMNREPNHFKQFIEIETERTNSIVQPNRLLIRGRYTINQIETLLVKYCKEYVLCKSCKSHDTIMEKARGIRIMFIECRNCEAKTTVNNLDVGFQPNIIKLC